MGMIKSGAIAIIEHRRGAMHTEVYESHLGAVLDTIDSGRLGDGVHGSDEHVAALVRVVQRANAILNRIRVQQAKEADEG